MLRYINCNLDFDFTFHIKVMASYLVTEYISWSGREEEDMWKELESYT